MPRERAAALTGIGGLARATAALAWIVPLAALAGLAAAGFPAGYGLALGALGLGALSLLWAYRRQPGWLVRRNYYAYQGGLFLILAWYLAARRLAAVGSPVDLASGAVAALTVILTARLLRQSLSPACQRSLYEVAGTAAIIAAMLYPLGNAIEPFSAAELGLPLVLVSVIAWFAIRDVAILFAVPVALSLWLYVGEWMLGVRGEWLGAAYLVTGALGAAAGYRLLRRQSPWHRLFYFTWFLSAAASLCLFSPFHGPGAWLAPLWPVIFVVVARAPESGRDPAFAWGLEAAGGLVALASIGVLLWQRLYAPAAAALLIDATLYARAAARHRIWLHLHSGAGSDKAIGRRQPEAAATASARVADP